jgi:hypothetical protein
MKDCDMSEHAKRNAAYTVFAGLICWLRVAAQLSRHLGRRLYVTTIHVFNWMLRIGGAALVWLHRLLPRLSRGLLMDAYLRAVRVVRVSAASTGSCTTASTFNAR